MAEEVGRIDLGLDVNKKYFNKQLSGLSSGAQSSVMNAFKPLGKMIGLALGGAAVISFTKSCLDLGSDLTEVQNVVDTTFTSMSDKVNSFANDAMSQFGMSETVAKKYMGTLGAMSKSMGFTEGASYDMASAVTGLAGDVASFYNMSTDEAYTKLKSIWTGETESLKEIGVLLTQTNLDQYALNNGFGKTTASMTEQEKVMLRYQYTMSALGAAQGDFAKTSDSWANQTRVLSLRFDALKATLGQSFINILTPLIKYLNQFISTLETAADSFSNFVSALTGNSISTASSSLSGLTSDALGTAEAVTSVGDATESTAKAIEKSLAGFDDITKLSDTASDKSNSPTSGNTGSGTTSGVIDTATKTTTAISPLAEKLKAAFEPLKDVSFDNLITSLSKLKESLEPFKENLFEGLKWGWDNIFVPMAKWTIEDALPATIDLIRGNLDLLNGVIESAKPNLKFFWDNFVEPIASFTGDVFTKSLKDLADILSEIGKNKAACDVLAGMTSAILTYKVGTKAYKALDFLTTKLATLSTFGKVGITISVAIAGFEAGNEIYNMLTGDDFSMGIVDQFKYIAGAISSGEIWGACADGIKADFQPLIDWFKSAGNDIGSIFTDCVGFIGDAFGGLWNSLTTLGNDIKNWAIGIYDNVIKTFQAIPGQFKTISSNAWASMKSGFSSATSWFSSLFSNSLNCVRNAFSINAIRSHFSTTLSAITGVFGGVGNWFGNLFSNAFQTISNTFTRTKVRRHFQDVYNGITAIFSGITGWFRDIFSSLVNIIKVPLNSIIKMINAVIGGLNKINFSIPGWVPGIGGRSYGINISKVPMLAQGGYVKANTPQLAMIGDNRHQGEVVAPEDKLTEMAMNAIREANNNGNSNVIVELLKQIIVLQKKPNPDIYLDGKRVKDAVVARINENTRSTGVCEILT